MASNVPVTTPPPLQQCRVPTLPRSQFLHFHVLPLVLDAVSSVGIPLDVALRTLQLDPPLPVSVSGGIDLAVDCILLRFRLGRAARLAGGGRRCCRRELGRPRRDSVGLAGGRGRGGGRRCCSRELQNESTNTRPGWP